MAANVGRNLKILKNSVVVAGIRTKSFSANGEPIDVTTDDEAGVRTLLADPAVRTLDISFDGVTKDDTLRGIMLDPAGTLNLTDITLEYPNGDEISGTFFFTNLEESGTYNDAVTFSGSLQNNGAWTFTPAV